MRAVLALLAATALAGPAAAQPAAAPPPVAPPAATQGFSPAAMRLARLVQPEDQGNAVVIAAAREGFIKALAEDPGNAALEAQYPGIQQAVWAAMEPLLRESIPADIPKLWVRLARVYTERLTPPEIEGLHRFYSTPAGQKVIRAMNEEADLAPIIASAAKSPDSTVSAEALAQAQAPARAAAARAIADGDEAVVAELAKVVPLPKLLALGVEVQRVTLEWMNEPDPEFDARLTAAIEETMTRYIADADARAAGGAGPGKKKGRRKT